LFKSDGDSGRLSIAALVKKQPMSNNLRVFTLSWSSRTSVL
jgi:hypothetical protein